jgi:multidrug transporter EmrE-like cation transporter
MSALGWLSLAFLALGPGAVAAVAQSYSMPRLGPPTYAIIANCELVTVVLVGVIVLGEQLTPTSALGGGLILGGILLHGWGRRPPRDRIAEKARVAAGWPAAGSVRCQIQQPVTVSRPTPAAGLALGTALDSPYRTLLGGGLQRVAMSRRPTPIYTTFDGRDPRRFAKPIDPKPEPASSA